MARSHPPTLTTLVSRALREECGVGRDERVLLALSGGGDSMALLHVLSRLAPQFGFSLTAHGVDHGLRAASATELDQASEFCAKLGVPFSRSRIALVDGGNLQARARAGRQAALLAAAEADGARWIATAHHAEDRAETVLIRLLRGAGPRGLGVLGPQRGRWIRPQIRARKADIELHLARHRLNFADDPSNRASRFLRTRVRAELMPLLAQLSPQIVAHLCALADALESEPNGGSNPRPALPEFVDESGIALSLNRAQRVLAVRARIRGQRFAKVSLADGRELSLDPATRELRLKVASPRLRKR